MTSPPLRADEIRRQAESMFAVRSTKEVRAVKEREKTDMAQRQKTERLRAMRLAREADELATALSQVKSKARP